MSVLQQFHCPSTKSVAGKQELHDQVLAQGGTFYWCGAPSLFHEMDKKEAFDNMGGHFCHLKNERGISAFATTKNAFETLKNNFASNIARLLHISFLQ